ncbi:pseudouridine synthase [Ferruginivarius sediminum]|uniref:Pseudouridine synthase n=1 Tax=Ferruginivarius sediminum TaxID=2661937 RepID=A0A369T7T0_9PROT|nr:pseudouridine synthase [Ferruginivarius sediminum]RDD60514.1 rRNA pseudouridine synthase [Ferruginivarius sediminum]
MSEPKAERVAKLIARAGICSRREAERLIEQGRVAVDGEPIDTPSLTLDDPGRITVDGERLPAPEPARLFRYHKPRGVLVAERDPHGRPTIYDRLPQSLPRVMPVGRLDVNSEGLLLLTNDGELKRRLELPATGWIRRYRVRVFGEVDEAALASLNAGITVEGVRYGPIEARLDQRTGSNAWLTVALREGKNREVRRVMEHLGLKVSRLLRIAYGPFQLGAMRPDQVSEIAPKVLAEQLGTKPPEATGTGTAKSKCQPPKSQSRSKRNANRRRTA